MQKDHKIELDYLNKKIEAITKDLEILMKYAKEKTHFDIEDDLHIILTKLNYNMEYTVPILLKRIENETKIK